MVAALAASLSAGVLHAQPARPAASAPTEALPAVAPARPEDSIQMLESQVQVIMTEARRQQELLGDMRQRLAEADAANRWLPWLVLALVAAAGLVAWMGLRVHRLQRALRRQKAARAEAERAVAALADSQASEPSTALSPDRPLLSGAAELSAASGTAAGPAAGLPHALVAGEAPLLKRELNLGSGVPPRPVSVEELLDLDQQVDFFLVLGQAQSAVDLLLGHVRATGGTNALPYFKLLEIYRQEDDEEAYERTRERFNQRFNAHAPAWGGDLQAGRSLEGYPEALARLQRAWPQPIRAVAELESLLLRRADLEPFDLPAYRDVLMLHALVRDLPAAPVPGLGAPTEPAVLSRDAWSPLPSLAPAAAPAAVLPLISEPIDTSEPAPRRRRSHLAEAPAAGLASVPLPAGEDQVDLLLPLDDGPMDITTPQPHVAERHVAQARLASWVFSRSTTSAAMPLDGAEKASMTTSRPMRLDLDLSDYAPAPREFTRPAAFTDVHLRRDHPLSGFGGFDELDTGSTPLPSRR